jgi:FtsP/CotA-like multicopper oxidase with cupredoxin domain
MMAFLACPLGTAGAGSVVVQSQGPDLMRRTKHEQRLKAALKALDRRKKNEGSGLVPKQRMWAPERKGSSGPAPGGAGGNGIKRSTMRLFRMALAQVGAPDLYASPNYANSKLPVGHCSTSTDALCQRDSDCPGYAPPAIAGGKQVPGGETCSGPAVPGTGIRKFVDSLAGLCPLGANNLGNCIPLASPDTTTYPGSDYYELGLKDFVQQFHSDLPNKTRLRGYYQKNPNPSAPRYDPKAGQSAYLGPFILASSYRPVRVKFTNELGVTGDGTAGPGAHGEIFLPVDTHLPGAGFGPDGLPYSQNRATLHLHGGNTPWISDGTQHQWTTPAGEQSSHKKGLGVEDVPDMPAPGDGALAFYWPNQQSGRLMFYHDHTYGITRLNVYAGEIAGYLLANGPDEDALAAGSVPGTVGTAADLAHLVPLIIQDKTFVPPAAQLAAQDPTWDASKWGGEDALWFPHVYMPNQWPGNPDQSNVNPFGRWDYGPWFGQALTALTEVNYLGAVINRPLTQPCTSAAAVTPANPSGATLCPSIPLPSLVPESFMDTPVINGVAYPTLTVEPAAYRFQILNAANERNWNLSFFVADAPGTEVTMVPAEVHTRTSPVPLCAPTAPISPITGLPAGCWPILWPSDNRQGGVPDPATAGPQWVQIGSEAGILPAPAVIPAMPIGYDQTTGKVVLNVTSKALFIAPTERADVVVDFSAFAGRTLILYNDAPAPVPASDPRQDYFTGAPDFTLTGGAPTPLPGYGPNTRTLMQIKVAAARTAPQVAFDIGSAAAALKRRFAASQPVPVVPEAIHSGLYDPNTSYSNTYLPITQVLPVNVTPIGQATPISIPVANKAIHELFSTNYGRMSSMLGVEVPFSTFANQTPVLYSSFDPATEFVEDNKPQIWRITHNGVDTHLIHFHLLNVQVLNRVGWDGVIRPPDANELGWKESVRMNPLEDIFIALQPVKQNLPWPQPDMWRPLDVDRALNTATQFTALDVHNNPVVVSNQMTNFGQEYIWHCHLLGHEEEDMLRAEVFVVAPETPSALTASGADPSAPPVTLSWRDNSKSAMTFTVQRATDALFSAGLATFQVNAPALGPGPVSFVDSTAAAGTTYYYRVQASKSLSSPAFVGADLGSSINPYIASSGWSNAASFPGQLPAASVRPASLDFGNQTAGTTSAAQTVTLANPGTAPLTIVGFSIAGAEFAQTNTCASPLAAGASCSIGVTFTPTSLGARTSTLTIDVGAPATAQTVALNGTGTAALNVSTASLAFGAQLVGTSSAARSLTLQNDSASPITGVAPSISGTDFTFTHDCGTLTSGARCTIDVQFTPAATGAHSAALNIAFTGPGSPAAVALTGTGVAPVLQASPSSLSFTSALMVQSAPATVAVSNSGDAPLTIDRIALANGASGAFALTHDCLSPLAAGASCTVAVTFRPTTWTSPQIGVLDVAVAAPASSQSIALTGTVAVPALTLAPTSVDFGAAPLIGASAPVSITLSNSGDAGSRLIIDNIALAGGTPMHFSQANVNCPIGGSGLAAGAKCTVKVSFPSGLLVLPGTKTSNLRVSVAAPATSQSVALRGTVLLLNLLRAAPGQ